MKTKNIKRIQLSFINKFIIISVFFILLSPVFSNGMYHITGENLNNLGLSIEDTSSSLVANSSGFKVGNNKTLIISKITIQEKQSWLNIDVELAGSDGLDMMVRDATGSLLYQKNNQQSKFSIDLGNLESAKNVKVLTLVLTFHGDVSVTSIKISYSGEGVIGYPSPFMPAINTLNIAYDLPNDAIVTLKIYDRRGRLVKTILEDYFVNAKGSSKENPSQWDGKNSNGSIVSSGIYIIFLNVKFSNSDNFSQDMQDYTSTFKFLVYR